LIRLFKIKSKLIIEIFFLLFRAVTRQPGRGDLNNSFNLVQGEQVLNQWASEQCASDCCGGINYTTLTDQRLLLRNDAFSIISCLCSCCCERPYHDKSIFLSKISEMETNRLTCMDKLCMWIRCHCPQDTIRFHGAFHGSCFPIGARAAYFNPEDKAAAQQAIAAAIASASRKG